MDVKTLSVAHSLQKFVILFLEEETDDDRSVCSRVCENVVGTTLFPPNSAIRTGTISTADSTASILVSRGARGAQFFSRSTKNS